MIGQKRYILLLSVFFNLRRDIVSLLVKDVCSCSFKLRYTYASSTYLQKMNDKTGMGWMVPKGVKFGKLDKLQFIANDEKSLDNEKGLVKIATKAVGLNFADVFTVNGLYSAANQIRNGENFIPGLEFSGVVMEDSSDDGNFNKNDRVLGFTRFGAYSDIVKVPPVFLKRLPDSWSFAEGASFIVQALTAWHGLVEIGRMPRIANKSTEQKPYVVLVHSASGGVGLWASEIAARRGAVVLGIVGSASKFDIFNDRIKNLSPSSQVMLRGEERDFSQRLANKLKEMHSLHDRDSNDSDLSQLAESGNGVDIVMESLGGKYFTASFDSLNSGGCLVTFGSTSYVSPGLGLNFFRLVQRYLTRPKIDPGTLTSRNIRLCGFNLIFLTEKTDDLDRELNECISCLSGDGDTDELDNMQPPVIGNMFDFRTQAVDALERLKSGQTIGKVVLENPHNPLQET